MHVVFADFEDGIGNGDSSAYKRILSVHSVRDIEDAVNLYQLARHHGMDFDEMLKNIDPSFHNNVLDELVHVKRTAYTGETDMRKEELISCMVSMYQYSAQVERFRRSKQILTFDKDFIAELMKTDDKFTIRYNVFATLPYNNFYIDLSDAKELCAELGIDGVLTQLQSVRTLDTEFWLLNCVFYQNGHSMTVVTQVLPNSEDDTELSVREIIDCISISTDIDDDVHADYKRIFPMLINVLMYLCSYEPDIHETMVSKRQRADAKKAKKNKKDYPEQTFKVGERFGASFRKWTVGKLGAEHVKSDGTKKVKPHIRRAHWHRYWYGPRNSPNRELRIRWVHECECNFDKDTEIEAVKHKVKK